MNTSPLQSNPINTSSTANPKHTEVNNSQVNALAENALQITNSTEESQPISNKELAVDKLLNNLRKYLETPNSDEKTILENLELAAKAGARFNGKCVNIPGAGYINGVYITSHNITSLQNAISKGASTPIINFLIEHSDVGNTDDYGRQALHYAAAKGNIASAKALLEKGVEINCRDLIGNTPLHMAAKSSNPEMIKFLVDAGANIDAQNDESITPLRFAVVAVIHNHKALDVLDKLLKCGANTEIVDRQNVKPEDIATRSNNPNKKQVINLIGQYSAKFKD